MSKLFILGLILLATVASTYAGCGCRPVGKRDLDNAPFGEKLKFPVLGAEKESKLVDGDMIFVKDDYKLYGGFRASIHGSRKWPNGEIPYMFSGMNGDGQNRVRGALSALTRATNNCVKFREVRRGSGAYVRVFSGGGCYSMIGKTGRAQDLSVGRGCLGTETIQHEFMHALGFYHEQSRSDRDRYVQINWQNINNQMCGNFETCRGCKTTTPYDIKSIMQYQGNAFSCNRRPTMVDRTNGQPPRRNMQLTSNDIKKIRDYYGCR